MGALLCVGVHVFVLALHRLSRLPGMCGDACRGHVINAGATDVAAVFPPVLTDVFNALPIAVIAVRM